MSMIGGLPTLPDFAQAGAILIHQHPDHSHHLLGSPPAPSEEQPPGQERGISAHQGRPGRRVGLRLHPPPDLVGREGVAMTDLRPSGTVSLAKRGWMRCRSRSGSKKETDVRVVSSEGYRLVVRPLRPPKTWKEPEG